MCGEQCVFLLYSGPVAMSTPCKLIAPGVAVNGTMSITKNELYFEMDEEDPQNKKTDSKVGLVKCCLSAACLFMNAFQWPCMVFMLGGIKK